MEIVEEINEEDQETVKKSSKIATNVLKSLSLEKITEL